MFKNKELTKQYLNHIKNAGYQYSKDDLGYYFDNGKEKFSINKTGPFYKCFYNIRKNNTWELKNRKNPTMDFNDCLVWILLNIQQKNR